MSKRNALLTAVVLLACCALHGAAQTTPNGATPTFWNLRNFTEFNFQLFYGWNSDFTRIFFRFVGSNSGWIGMAFGSSLTNTDMVVIRQPSTTPLVEHYVSSSANSAPTLATSQAWRWEGGQFTSAGSVWDISVSRLATLPVDQQDTTITFTPMNIIFGVGSSQTVTSNFQSSRSYTGVVFSRSGPLCSPYCATCSGPLINNCLTCPSSSVLYKSQCIPDEPVFWNRLINSTQVSNFLIDYGFTEFNDYLYLRFRGGYTGYIGVGFGTTIAGTDFLIVKRIGNTLFANDYVGASGNRFTLDTQQDVVLVSGDRSQATPNYWNSVVILRAMNTLEYAQDKLLTANTATSVYIVFGPNDDDTQSPSKSEALGSFMLASQQACDATCKTCFGPDPNQCITCYAAYVYVSDTAVCLPCFAGCSACTGTLINQCTACLSQRSLFNGQCILCHSSCATCSGTSAQQCVTCSSSSQVVYYGTCIDALPRFWNSILVAGSFYLYYGFDSGNNYIYMKFKGQNIGWISVTFASTLTNADMIQIFISNGATRVVDAWSLGPTQQVSDSTQNLLYLRGGRDEFGNWDVDIVRRTTTGDTAQDSNILLNQQIPLTFTFGTNDNVALQYSIIVQLTNQIFNTTRAFDCAASCQTCIGPTVIDCASCRSPLVLSSGQCVTCYWNCATCSGPTQTDCLSCISPFQLSGTTCVQPQQPECDLSCLTCKDVGYSDCSTCDVSTRTFFKGYCLLNQPTFWNKIESANDLTLYYGFDVNNTDFIYFRIVGNRNGYIAVGFGHQQSVAMDVFMLYRQGGQLIVSDRQSTTYAMPQSDGDDAQDVVITDGQRDAQNNWDVTVAKRMQSGDSKDVQITSDLEYPLCLVTSTSDDPSTMHDTVVLIDPIEFVNEQICDASCGAGGCKGPEPSDCIQQTTVMRGGLTTTDFLTYTHASVLMAHACVVVALLMALLF